MANIKSAEKRIRQSEKARQRNRAYRSRMRTQVKKLNEQIAAGDRGAAQGLLPETLRLIDATAQKRVIHRNTAARTKSRLEKAVRRLGA